MYGSRAEKSWTKLFTKTHEAGTWVAYCHITGIKNLSGNNKGQRLHACMMFMNHSSSNFHFVMICRDHDAVTILFTDCLCQESDFGCVWLCFGVLTTLKC